MKIAHRIYAKPNYLLKIYAFMEHYEKENRCKPSNADFVVAGFATSTSVIRYYLDRMEELSMIEQPKVERNGRLITPSRSIVLLPLSEAHPVITNLLQKDS